MARDEMNLIEWERRFDNHEFADPNVSVQCEAGWFDWFCKDTSLRNKTKSLGKKVKQIMKSPKVNCKTSYVFFKNNCPMCGPLYDSFSICDMESGDVLFWVTPRSGHSGMAEVWDGKADKEVKGTWKDIKEFFEI
jgi:hypothetical protein